MEPNNLTRQTLTVESLQLSTDNPRLFDMRNVPAREKSQNKLINRMLKEDLIELIKDIAENGLDPSQLVMVSRAKTENRKERYMVCEGNRRVAALKLLIKPELAADSSVAAQIKDIKKKYQGNISSDVSCLIGAGISDFKHWLKVRHEGGQKGRGLKPWSSLSQEDWRRNHGEKRRYKYALELYELAINSSWIKSQIQYDTTTIHRIISSSHFTFLPYEPGAEKHVLNDLSDDNLRIFRRLVKDVSKADFTVQRVNTNEKIAAYLEKIALACMVSIPPPKQELPKNPAQKNREGKLENKPHGQKTQRRNRVALAADEQALDIDNERAQAILVELRKISLKHGKNAVAVLIRVLVEIIVRDRRSPVVKNHIKKGGELSFRKAVVGLIDAIQDSDAVKNDKNDKEFLEMMRIESQSDPKSLLHLDILHVFVHNSRYNPTLDGLREIWVNYYQFLDIVCEFYKSQTK